MRLKIYFIVIRMFVKFVKYLDIIKKNFYIVKLYVDVYIY